MRLLALDFETTGLSPETDHIIEIGAAFWDTERKSLFHSRGFLVRLPVGVSISAESTALTGITTDDLREFGSDFPDAIVGLARVAERVRVDYVVGHNFRVFDRAFLRAAAGRLLSRVPELDALMALPVLDTLADLPFPEGMKTRVLSHLAAEHGFLNPFPHRALTDAMTSLRLLSSYELSEVISRAACPIVTVAAFGLPFERKDEAKNAGFFWDPDMRVWKKALKECDLWKIAHLAFSVREVKREEP